MRSKKRGDKRTVPMQFTEEEKEAIRRWRPVYHAALREMMPIQAHAWHEFWDAGRTAL